MYSTQLGGSVTFHNENTGLVEDDDYRFTITGDGESDGEFYGLSYGATLLPFFDSAIGFSFGS